MSDAPNRQLVQRFSRHPLVMEVVRLATALASDRSEFVVFDRGRAVVVGSLDDGILQPRPLHDAEHEVRDGATWFAGEHWSSVAFHDSNGAVVGAVSVATALDEERCEPFLGLARLVTTYLAESNALEAPPGRPTADSDAAQPEHHDGSSSAAASSGARPARPDNDPRFAAAMLENLRDLVMVLDVDFEIVWASRSLGSLLGWNPTEFVGKPGTDFIHPDDLQAALDAANRLATGHQVHQIPLRLLNVRKEWSSVLITGLDASSDDRIGGLVLSVRNDDREGEAAQELVRTQTFSSAILECLTDAVIATDSNGAITRINEAARQLFSLDATAPPSAVTIDQLPLLEEGLPVPDEKHPLQSDSTSPLEGHELSIIHPDGLQYVRVHTERVMKDDDDLGLVMTLTNTTAAHAAAVELTTRALHDQLTGLANRRQLHEHLADPVLRTLPGQVAACFVDLDGFKGINDVHGHRTGDALLRIAAGRLGGEMRDGDLLARQGGDEFVALFFGLDAADEALTISERFREVLSNPYEVDGSVYHLTTSIGVALAPHTDLDDDLLLQQADIALYAAKARGRDRVELFDQELANAAEIEAHHRNLVRRALANDGLVMHFQPVVDSDSGTITGVEALARCRTDDGELLMPSGFFDAIVGSSLMVDLDRRAFELSCKAAATLERACPDRPLWVACNFASTTLMQNDLLGMVISTIEATGVDPSRICIEVTESAAFEAGANAIEALAELHRRGIRIALDDFGTGYSSLAHLRDLPLTTVKVDRSFIGRLDTGNSERSISAAVVKLADDLGLDVVAEGVETSEHLSAARDLGFRTVQGWYYAPALSLENMLDAITAPNQRPEAPTTALANLGRSVS